MIKAFKNGPSELQGTGIKIGDEKYMFLRDVGDSFYGKKGVSQSASLIVRQVQFQEQRAAHDGCIVIEPAMRPVHADELLPRVTHRAMVSVSQSRARLYSLESIRKAYSLRMPTRS